MSGKTCGNCKYVELETSEEPCVECLRHAGPAFIKWEPAPDFPEPSGKVLTVEDAAADVLGVPRPGDGEPPYSELQAMNEEQAKTIRNLRGVISQWASTGAPAPVVQPGGVPQEVRDALFEVDDHIARMHGDDRGGFPAVEVLRRFLDALDAAPAPVAQPLTDMQIGKAFFSPPGLLNEFVASAQTVRRLARTVERACAEAWGVKLVEATGQEGGAA